MELAIRTMVHGGRDAHHADEAGTVMQEFQPAAST